MNKRVNKVLFLAIAVSSLFLTQYVFNTLNVSAQMPPEPGTVVMPQSPAIGSNSDSLQLQTFPFATLTPTPGTNPTASSSAEGKSTPGGTIVTGGSGSAGVLGSVPLYHQWDPRWRSKSFGCGTTMAAAACGPTALAMVLSYYTNKAVLPPEVADVVLANKLRVCNAGTAHAAITKIPPMYGLRSKNITWSQAKTYLSQGIPVVQVHGPGFFTSGGHFIVLTKNSPAGSQNYLVNDPDGRHRTVATEKQIISSLKQSWVISK